jgi:hypothetical protein
VWSGDVFPHENPISRRKSRGVLDAPFAFVRWAAASAVTEMSLLADDVSRDQAVGAGIAYCRRADEGGPYRRRTEHTMFSEQERTDETIARYEIEANRFIGHYCRDHHAEVCHAPYESRVCMATSWFLGRHGVWSKAYIRFMANALGQRLETFASSGLIDINPDPEKSLLARLKHARPQPAEKRKKADKAQKVAHQKKVAAKKKKAATKKRRKSRKSLPMGELRKLRKYFSSRPDEFSRWIAGYIIIASRLGWRPGEIVNLQREGNIVCAPAEKHTNGRGLTDTCAVDISAYIEKARLIKSVSLECEIDRWIADARKWETYYGGRARLLANINGRLATASKNCEIARVCTYTFRHVAISCMKASGFTCAEIAVIINHRTDRTAGEHYGKRRHGVKRPTKMLRFDPLRLHLVRNQTRSFQPAAVSAKDAVKEAISASQLPEGATLEAEAVSQFSF